MKKKTAFTGASKCEHCNKRLDIRFDKKHRRFCSNACKQAAYRERKSKGKALKELIDATER